jgi:hypothetical protein
MAIHESFCEAAFVIDAGFYHRIDFFKGDCKGFFTEDMQSRLEGADAPLSVQMVRQADVDGIYCPGLEHLIVAAKRERDFPMLGVCLCVLQIATGDSNQLSTLRCPYSRYQATVYMSGGEQAPAYFIHLISLWKVIRTGPAIAKLKADLAFLTLLFYIKDI